MSQDDKEKLIKKVFICIYSSNRLQDGYQTALLQPTLDNLPSKITEEGTLTLLMVVLSTELIFILITYILTEVTTILKICNLIQ